MDNIPVRVSFNASDLEACRRIIAGLQLIFEHAHGPVVARDLFVSQTKSKRDVQGTANLRLITEYLDSGLSVKAFAKKLAEKNRALPRSRRRGIISTIPEAIEKQIGRLKKDMKRTGVYDTFVTLHAKESGEDNSQ